VVIGCVDHQRTQLAKFGLQQSCGPVAAQGPKAIAANEFGKFSAVVGGGATPGPHLHEPNSQAG
jgi:hypothetical protein